MTQTEAIIGLLMGAGGFVVAVVIAVGWAVTRRRSDDDEDPRLGD